MEKKAEFAPGIPSRETHKAIPKITDPVTWKFVEQKHFARKAGEHSDIRISDGKTAFSWASRKGIPGPGEKFMVYRQPDHSPKYMDFRGMLPEGYGHGLVEIARQGYAKIQRSESGKIKFALLDSKNPQEFAMVHLPRYGDRNWLMINTTPTQESRKDVPLTKLKFKEAKVPDLHNYMSNRYALESKLDGAAVVVKIGDKVEVFSHVPSVTGELINHTYLTRSDEVAPPPGLKDTVVRAELLAVKGGKAVPMRELGGIMNSAPQKGLAALKEKGLKLIVAPYKVDRFKGEDMSYHPYSKNLEALKEIVGLMPSNWKLPDVAVRRAKKEALVEMIKGKRHKLTEEGLVAWPLNEAAADPIKIKFKDHIQVYINDVYPMMVRGKPVELAGGFTYSLKPEGEAVGKVGTGLSLQLRKDLWGTRNEVKGRKVIISSIGQFPSGAYRAPSFISFHL
jgi:hypothetical protein